MADFKDHIGPYWPGYPRIANLVVLYGNFSGVFWLEVTYTVLAAAIPTLRSASRAWIYVYLQRY